MGGRDSPRAGPSVYTRSSQATDNTPTNSRYEYSNKAAIAQVLATLIQSWLLIDTGLMKAAPTLILGSLHNNPVEPLDMNDDQASWFGSIPYFCTPVTSFASGLIQEVIGRKGAMILVNIPIFGAWILLYFANSITALYAVAVIMGLCVGLTEAPLSSYIGEIGEPHLRGTLATIMTTAIIIGYFIMYTLGYFFDWRTTALISSAFPVITFALMTQSPESSPWLIGQSRYKDARRSLRWLRGWATADAVEEEFQSLISHQKDSMAKSRNEDDGSYVGFGEVEENGFFRSQFRTLKRANILRPLLLVFITSFFCFVAILRGMTPYLIGELKSLNTPINPTLVLIASQVLVLVGAVANMSLLRYFGKRKIALFSYAMASVSILGIGAYSSFLQGSTLHPLLVWIPTILLLIISFLSGFSIQVLPWQLMTEVFPPVGRSLATGICAAWTHLVISALIKSYLYIKMWIGFSGLMYLYGSISVVGLLYHYIYLPETEGKTLKQIETYFTSNHDRVEKFSIEKSDQNGES